MTAPRGAHLQPTPWARAALDPDVAIELSRRARELGAYLGLNGRHASGPWIVDVHSRERRLRIRGWDLAATAREALERFAHGADDRHVTYRAGVDGVEHAHVGSRPIWTLCKRPAIAEAYSHPPSATCAACVRALDTRIAA